MIPTFMRTPDGAARPDRRSRRRSTRPAHNIANANTARLLAPAGRADRRAPSMIAAVASTNGSAACSSAPASTSTQISRDPRPVPRHPVPRPEQRRLGSATTATTTRSTRSQTGARRAERRNGLSTQLAKLLERLERPRERARRTPARAPGAGRRRADARADASTRSIGQLSTVQSQAQTQYQTLTACPSGQRPERRQPDRQAQRRRSARRRRPASSPNDLDGPARPAARLRSPRSPSVSVTDHGQRHGQGQLRRRRDARSSAARRSTGRRR